MGLRVLTVTDDDGFVDVVAQTANVETTLVTQAQGGQTLVVTEVISVVATQGATEIVQVKQAANGMTVTG